MKANFKHGGIFGAGLLLGTVGLKVLKSTCVKKAATQGIAAGLRAKECVMDATSKVQADVEDMVADAKVINEKLETERVAKEAEEKAAECGCDVESPAIKNAISAGEETKAAETNAKDAIKKVEEAE